MANILMNPDNTSDFDKLFGAIFDTEEYENDCEIVGEKPVFKNGEPDEEHRKYVRKLVEELKAQEDEINREEMNEIRSDLARQLIKAFEEAGVKKVDLGLTQSEQQNIVKLYEKYLSEKNIGNP